MVDQGGLLKRESALKGIRVAPVMGSENVQSLAIRSPTTMSREGFN